MHQSQSTQTISQLDERRGAYFYLKIDAETVEQFSQKRKTRLICKLDNQLEFRCGLNHFGDGNFFIILSKKNLKQIGKELGDSVNFEIREDPNPLGVEMPEVLEVLLAQDEDLKSKFDQLSMGKKRSVIFAMHKIKNIDLQVTRTAELINKASEGRR
jgi:hypothetical protein